MVAGLKLAPLSTTQRQRLHVPGNISGVVVTAIGGDSPLARLDLVPGDVIQTIDQQPVASPKDALAKIEAAAASPDKTVLMLINRHGTSRYLALPLTEPWNQRRERLISGSPGPSCPLHRAVRPRFWTLYSAAASLGRWPCNSATRALV